MTTKIDYDENIKRSAEVFFTNKVDVHITLISGSWCRGYITAVNEDHLILDEFMDGTMPIMFNKILGIEKRRVKK